MSLPPPPPTLSSGSTAPMTTAPPLTAPMTSAAGTTALAGHVSTAAPLAPPSPVPSAPLPSAVFTPEQVTSILRDLVTAVESLHLQQQQYAAGPYVPLPTAPIAAYVHMPWPPQGVSAYGAPLMLSFQAPQPNGPPAAAAPLWHLAPAPSAAPWPLQQTPQAAATGPLQPPFSVPSPSLISSGTTAPPGLPLHQVRFPPSPSPLPAWAAASSPSPVYTTAAAEPTPFPQFGGPSGSAGHYPEYSDQAPPASLFRSSEPVRHGGPTQTPPRFAKIDFATYDGTEDPLNWLNQCDQFFRGQRTLASECTWLASYHLRGAAQTWYYALEQDEGAMPPWERFHELCLLRFGPPVHGSRLAELGRLPFTSTVQDYADRF
nr:vegetative cell wall protein gp1-like [Aegilops tauschii subsp. strangulata]